MSIKRLSREFDKPQTLGPIIMAAREAMRTLDSQRYVVGLGGTGAMGIESIGRLLKEDEIVCNRINFAIEWPEYTAPL